MNALNVNISYSYTTRGIIEEQGVEYREPYVSVNINSNNGCNTGWLGDNINGRTILIYKKNPALMHLWFKCKNEICDSTVSLRILSPGEECCAFDIELKPLMRSEFPESCDRYYCIPARHENTFMSSSERIHSALDAILKVSKEFFDTRDRWLGEVINFIDNGPLPSKHALQLDPALERNIRQTLGNQEGAMNLLEDLKRETYSQDIQMILERLLRGVYGDFSSEFEPTTKLTADLERRNLGHLVKNIYQGRYDHDGPNAAKNIEKVVSTCVELLKKDKINL